MNDRLTPYVMGVARLADQLTEEIRLAESRRQVRLDGLLVQELLGDLRVAPLCNLRSLTIPLRAAEAALRAMVRAGWVRYEPFGSRGRRWILVAGAKIPDPPEPVATTPPPRIADLEPNCTGPRPEPPKSRGPFEFPHTLNVREVLR